MVFVWDENKNRANRQKHGVAFDTAARVFDDPFAVSYVDRAIGEEVRWHTVGLVGGVAMLLVVHLIKDEDNGDEEIRIISARKANRRERALYEGAH